jgi:hypothetical protein
MTRFEITSAVESVLSQADPRLALVSIRALPFSWQLHFEDRDGVERVITVHQGSTASITQSITHALRCCL